MSKHIDRMKRAIEFGRPDCVPMELVDVPLIYDAYGTCDPRAVTIPPGAENFDALWVTYHWTLESLGTNEAGEPLRMDEWGCKQSVPNDTSSAYVILDSPHLATMEDVRNYTWPDPARTDRFFACRKAVIQEHYADRFVTGFLDAGPFLLAFNLMGYDGLLMKLAEDLDVVKEVVGRIHDYQKALVPKFAEMGAHMINIIDEVAGTSGMMFHPDVWREHFQPMLADLLKTIHDHGMYTSLLLDGDVSAIMPDLMDMELDQQFFAQPLCMGLDRIQEYCASKRCVKLAVDMMETMTTGTADQIAAEVDEFVRRFHTDRGGLVFQAMRWHRPEYAAERVKAQIDAMNKYRKGA